jgi:hypothetical protein
VERMIPVFDYRSKDEDEIEMIGNENHAQIVTQSIQLAEDAWQEMSIKQEAWNVIKNEENVTEEDKIQEIRADVQETSGEYRTRSVRISRPPTRLIETAYAVLREMYRDNFGEGSENVNKDIIECTYAMKKALLFQKAVLTKPEEAMKALKEEVAKALKINIWHPVHLDDLSQEQRKLIIPQMINYLEKYKPDATFEKYKVRVLARGDKQEFTGESEGPVTRIETLLILLSVAIYEDLAMLKVDVGSAFMRTPMPYDVRHKWLKLDKKVVELLLKIQPDKYRNYVTKDGSIIVEMDKLSYGYVKAAHYWYKELVKVFEKNKYKVSKKDKCMFIK